jgi:hypothetical protein
MAYIFANGSGTEADPYLVATADDLNRVRDYLSAHFKQVADIDLSGYENWEPIGTYDYGYGQELGFRGIYDGNGHTIRHLKINSIDREWVGLFGAANNAVIKNLDLIDVDVSGGIDEDGNWIYGSIVGALAGLVFGNTDIINCSSTGNLTGGYLAGGLVGQVAGSNISDCHSSANVTGRSVAGGLIGLAYGYDDPNVGNNYCCVSNCYSTGSVMSYLGRGEKFLGGLVGWIEMDYARVFNCYSASTLLDRYDSGYVGGLFGVAYLERETEEYNVLNCYSICDISGGMASGGLIGILGKIAGITFTICNCYSASSISSMGAVGGLIASLEIKGGEPDPENVIIISSYYDSDKVPEYEGGLPIDKGTPKTTAEMKQQSTYEGWDFTNIWAIEPDKNDGYPYLLYKASDDLFQPWTAPKLEPSWWEGFKLPFNVLELDEDAPIAIQRNFKEIEHFINILGRTSGEIKDSIGQLAAAAGGEPSEYPIEWSDEEESDVPSTDSNFAGYLLGKEGQMGSIDASIKTDEFGGINEVWIARVIDRQGIVEIYDSDAPEHIFRTVAREFNLPIVNFGAEIVDVAIEFDGTYNQYGIFISDAAPDLFWVERTSDEDIIYSVKWNGIGTPPEPIELARAYLGDLYGRSRDLDSSITV